MFRALTCFVICNLMLLLTGCVIVDAENSCRARGGTWTEFSAIGEPIWPGRCVGASSTWREDCDDIRGQIAGGSYRDLPSYCEGYFENDKPKASLPTFIRTENLAAFPKLADQPTKGESYLMNVVSPFLCKVTGSGRPEENIKSMGGEVNEVDVDTG